MMTTALGALLSHWRRRPLQLATLVMGLALATALWSAVEAINGEARASYARAAAVLGQDQLRYLASRDGGRLTQAQYLDLRRGGWLVSPLLDGEWRAGSISLRLLGIDPLTAPPQAATVDVAGEGSLLSFITAPGQFHVNPETAARLSAAKTLPLVLSEKIPPGIAITDIGVAQQLLGAEGQISRLLLAPEQPLSRAPLEIVAPGLVERQPATAADLSRLTDSFHLNLTAFAVLAFAVGLFIVHAAIGLAFEQRRPVFRTLRALGVSARALVLLLAGELLAFALIAGLAGVVIGLGLAALLLPDVSATLRGLYGAEVPGTLTLRPAAWLAAARHCPARRLRVGGARLLAGLATAAAGACAAGGLAAVEPVIDQASIRRGPRSLCGGRSDLALRLGSRLGLCPAGLPASGCRADPAPRSRAGPQARTPQREGCGGRMVLGRYAPAASRPVAGPDGAAARAGGQHRCRHHGGKLPPDLYGLARSAPGVRALCHRT